MEYIDTNIILRYLSKDDPDKAARAYALLQEVEQGKRIVITTEIVIAEVLYVLSSKRTYNVPRQEIVKRLLPVLMLKGLKIGCKPSDKLMYADALNLYAITNLDFADALLIARMKQDNIMVINSFDSDFDAFPEITRREPELPEKHAA
jgi:uncharacterized protein